VKERRACAAERFGDLDAHDPELEQLVDEHPRNRGAVVHFADERPDLASGELRHGIAKQLLVLRQARQGGLAGHRGFGSHDACD
jgi:hypothetical protein